MNSHTEFDKALTERAASMIEREPDSTPDWPRPEFYWNFGMKGNPCSITCICPETGKVSIHLAADLRQSGEALIEQVFDGTISEFVFSLMKKGAECE